MTPRLADALGLYVKLLRYRERDVSVHWSPSQPSSGKCFLANSSVNCPARNSLVPAGPRILSETGPRSGWKRSSKAKKRQHSLSTATK